MKDKIQFAYPTLPSNVRLLKWIDGYHIYAKVDNEDIIDANSNQKWSTVKEAVDAVNWFLKTYKRKEGEK